ncbi:MAG TPA: hypothetical protein VHC19_06045 [Pirellulales bacterium]|nr:hypothetical protein [Pirellulales bacterium]
MVLGVGGLCSLAYQKRAALGPDEEGVYHACELYQQQRYVFFEEDGDRRISRLFVDPGIPWGDWNSVIDYRFLTSLPYLRELSIPSHVLSNRKLIMLTRIEGLELLDLRGCSGFSEFTISEFQRKRRDVRVLLSGKTKSIYQLPLSERNAASQAGPASQYERPERSPRKFHDWDGMLGSAAPTGHGSPGR